MLGREACGTVEGLGDDVTEFEIGDRVAYMSGEVIPSIALHLTLGICGIHGSTNKIHHSCP